MENWRIRATTLTITNKKILKKYFFFFHFGVFKAKIVKNKKINITNKKKKVLKVFQKLIEMIGDKQKLCFQKIK